MFLPERAASAVAPARRDEEEKQQEWLSFLEECDLQDYADLLRRHGFDDMDTLAEIDSSDLKDLRMPACDAGRLLKRLERFRAAHPSASESPVTAFLGSIGLQQYAELLLRNGFDDMEALLLIRETDMWDMGMLRGHGLKLAKHLRELRAAAPAPPDRACAAVRAVVPRRAPRSAAPREAPHGGETVRNLVERSWEDIQRLGCLTVGERLCKNFFALAPELWDLFSPQSRYAYTEDTAADLVGKGGEREAPALRKHFAKVLEVVGTTAAGPCEPSRSLPVLWHLGASHASCGVREDHWKVLGDAINVTLKEYLGDVFTPEVQLAWTLAYSFISAVMMEGVKGTSLARTSSSGEGPASSEAGESVVPPSSSTTRTPSVPSSSDETGGPPEQHVGPAPSDASLESLPEQRAGPVLSVAALGGLPEQQVGPTLSAAALGGLPEQHAGLGRETVQEAAAEQGKAKQSPQGLDNPAGARGKCVDGAAGARGKSASTKGLALKPFMGHPPLGSRQTLGTRRPS